MKLPSLSGTLRSSVQIWRNRKVLPQLFAMARCDQLDEASIKASRRLIARGHSASAKSFCPVGEKGQPIPWYTYPLVDFLDSLDTQSWSVIEFGSGQSTLYWAARTSRVLSLEGNREWFLNTKKIMPPNANLVYVASQEDITNQLRNIGFSPELVVIDGLQREACAKTSIEIFGLSPIYILDNSDWFPKAVGTLRQAGLIEIKFSGFGPINSYAWCSSIWLNENNLPLLAKIKNGVFNVPGGLPPSDTEDRASCDG